MSREEIPPYQLQPLIAAVLEGNWRSSEPPPSIICAQALGSEIYVGCSNGELLRFSLHVQDNGSPGSYGLLSRQSLPNNKAVDELVLAPSISRLIVLSDRQLYFYTLPALDMVPSNIIKPVRNVVAFAVDQQHLRRPPPRPETPVQGDPIDLCIIKRSSISLFTLRDKLFFQKDIPLPSSATLARRTGRHLCVADHENYNIIDLDAGLLFPLLPLSQAPDSGPVKPSITVINDNEFLILSWTGTSTLGVFITGDGDPVRGTLEWSTHPVSVSLDYPYVMTLLRNNVIEIHSVETQAIVQVVPAPTSASNAPKALFSSAGGFFVPSMQRAEKLRPIPFRLSRPSVEQASSQDLERTEKDEVQEAQEGDIEEELDTL